MLRYGVFVYLSLMLKSINILGWLVAIVALVIMALSMRACQKNKDEREELASMLKAEQDTTKHYRNALGEEVATRMVVEGGLKNMKEFFTKEEMKELEDRFDLKFKNLRSYISVASKGDVILPPVGEPVIVYKDVPGAPGKTISYMKQLFAGQWDSVNVRVGDSAYAHVRYWDTTRLVLKDTVTGGLFNRKRYSLINVQNANPNVRNTITGAYLVRQDVKRGTFELSARGGYRHFQTNSALSGAYGGLEGQLLLGRVTVSGSYNRELGGAAVSFIEVGGKFRLIRF